MIARALERAFDRLAENEMRAHQLHRLTRGAAQRRQPEPPRKIGDKPSRLRRVDDARGKAEREGAGLNEQRVRRRLVMREIAGRELVGDQPVGGCVVGNPQQRLGQRHDGEPFARGEREFMQKIFDAAECVAPLAHVANERPRRRLDRVARLRAGAGGEKSSGQVLIGRRIRRGERRRKRNDTRRHGWSL